VLWPQSGQAVAGRPYCDPAQCARRL